jgi:hypothetical protein
MAGVATRLVDLVPGTEPPLGFDRRVLARARDITPASRTSRLVHLPGRRPRLVAGIGAAVAAAALTFGSVGWFMGHSSHSGSQQLVAEAAFHQGGSTVGEVYAYRDTDDPMWLTMTVQGVKGGPRVTCELVAANGSVTRIGSFDLVDGSGTWGAPDPAGLTGITGARLVDRNGQLLATATFHA